MTESHRAKRRVRRQRSQREREIPKVRDLCRGVESVDSPRRSRARIGMTLTVSLPLAIVALEVGLSGAFNSPRDIDVPSSVSPPAAVRITARVAGHPASPGDVIVLDVAASSPLEQARVDVFDHLIPMWSTGDRSRWEALIGIDVETRPGRYPAIVRGLSVGGEPTTTHVTLTVTRKVFGTRRLLVDPRFSEPPASEMPRIEREAQRLNALFSAVTGARYWNWPFEAPVAARASSPFGVRSVFNGVPRSRHNGVDFASLPGAPVHAPAGGRVALAEPLYFTGTTVIIDHGQGLYSLLAHLERAVVQSDDSVARGDVIGFVGATGRATGPHLHWSVRLQGARVDPLSLVSLQRPLAQ
jgi:murein DD-endopeptidase MepM/ murein hydrolase activator NlpD